MTDYTELDKVHCVDIFDLCAAQPSQSVDCILCDLPYGTTACAWDSVIPFEPMWAAFKRIIKPRGAIVLTASQPFTSALVMSNIQSYRHQWVWNKNNSAGFMTVNVRPFQVTEDILIFGVSGVNYYPILNSRGVPRLKGGYSKSLAYDLSPSKSKSKSNVYYPKNLLHFSGANQADKEHPTQKPVALFRYLIRTYTRPNELVFDPCVGSGTTALAAREEQRHFICGDSSPEYVAIAQKRLDAPYTLPMFAAGD